MYPVEREGPASIARLEGQYSSLDDEVMDEARAALLQLADECEPPYLVLDVSAVEYVSSMFIEMLFRCHTRLKRRGGTLAFCSPGDFLH
ncbi:MAG TPA: STAS domain-containing protein, partial [Pirellulales bacterium]